MLAVVLLLSACTPEPSPTPTATPSAPPGQPSPTVELPTVGPPFPTVDPELGGVVEAVLTDAVRRMDRPRQQFELVRAERGVWPNPSLGCPDPTVQYNDVETPGYWVVLTVTGIEVDYRVTDDGELLLCTIPPRLREGPLG